MTPTSTATPDPASPLAPAPAPSATTTPAPGCEITTTYQGTIVDARSVGRVSTRAADPTPWLFAGALVSLLGVGLFAAELSRAADHAQQAPLPRDTTPSVEVLEDPSSSRGAGLISAEETTPEDPRGLDLGALAAALALLGLVPLGVGVSLRRSPARDRFTVGEGNSVDFPIALSAADRRRFDADGRFTLLRAAGDRLVLGLCPSLTGTVAHGGARTDVAALASSGRRTWALPAGARAELELGAAKFEIECSPPAELALGRRPFDTGFLVSNLASAALIGGILFSVQLRSPEPASIEEIEELEMTQRIFAFLERPAVEPDEDPQAKREREPDPKASYYNTRGSAPRPDETQRRVAPRHSAPADAGAPELDEDAEQLPRFGRVALTKAVPQKRRGVTILDEARAQAGLFAFADGFAETQDASMHLYRDDDDLEMWREAQATPAPSLMPGGLDLASGTRRGGGGRAEGALNPDGSDASDKRAFAKHIIASTGFGANNAWKRQAEDPRAAFDDASMHRPRERKRVKAKNALSPKKALAQAPIGSVMSKGQITVDGLRSAGSVERVAKHHIATFRKCYEKALAKRPTLKGELTIAFTITEDGLVEKFKIKKNTLKSGAVSGCVARHVNKWMFSIQEDMGDTRVVFPMRFSPGM